LADLITYSTVPPLSIRYKQMMKATFVFLVGFLLSTTFSL